ncbi:MAG: NADP-specific glutamate dehydrogenase, partial [Planctomycetota bacterium]
MLVREEVPSFIQDLLERVETRNPGEPEFLQAVHEVVTTLTPAVERRPDIMKAKILDRLVEPERLIQFRVPWVDDAGEVHV